MSAQSEYRARLKKAGLCTRWRCVFDEIDKEDDDGH